MNEKQNSLRSLFNEAAEITDAAERAAYLQRACGDDASLRQRLDQLLKAHADAGGFLAGPGATTMLPVTEKPGDRIGRYKLLQGIGEGGCGVVYMAEQEEPVRRRVALKVIKLGMDTKSVIARFEAERQALALMDHPNIAKVLDAGATDAGRPYFVMELVKGVRITEYCDQNNLPTIARLDLFTQVCHAIQHAHQKGIIHRDIKPSNILVTLHDGVPVPKVIDFGIAKATDQRLTDKTFFTAFEQFMGTPAYMSPEQAEMSGLDIDTRSDIYALGVLLYELLTGKPPFDGKELLASGLDAMRRTIREQEPARPSTRLTMELVAADVRRLHSKSEIRDPKSEEEEVRASSRRLLQVKELIPLLRGDLDWIVMKALEKDRTRRYDTANGLATDIARHLNNEPIVARPPTPIYRFQKMVRRNKLAFAAVSAVLAALILGLGISTWMFFKEKHARQRAVAAEKQAKTEASKSQQVAQFLKDMLEGVGPSVALGQDTTMLREILDKTAERIGKDLKDQPGVEAELRNTIGEVYRVLGQYEKAETMHREALAMRRKLLSNEHPAVADSLHNLARVLRGQGKLAEAETMHREALAMRRKLLGNEHPDVAKSLNNLGRVLERRGKLAEDETMQRDALVIQRKLLGNEHPDVANSLHNLAAALGGQGKLAEAETMHREALARRRKLSGNEHPDVATSLNSLAVVLQAENKLAEAEKTQREALAMWTKLLGNDHPEVATSLHNLATVLLSQSRLAEAETMFREAVAMRRKLWGIEHSDVATSLGSLAVVLHRQGKLAEAETMFREALAMIKELLDNEYPNAVNLLYNLAVVLHDQGKLGEAETMYRETLACARRLATNDSPRIEGPMSYLAENLYRQRKYAEAERLYRECLQSQLTHDVATEAKVVTTSASLGRLLADWAWAEHVSKSEIPNPKSETAGRAREAERLLRDCLASRLRGTNATGWRMGDARSRLGGALLAVAVTDAALSAEARQTKLSEAESLLVEGNESLQQSRGADSKYKRDALIRLIHLYEAWDKPDKLTDWKQKLADFDKAEIEKQAAAPKP
ncbi:MAG TPA: serine/threonine-protein kinase [Verrucomicrobiae bacterium]|jgi:serine/threonine protein kinase/tetratricopeptide (TPR) repeat protein